ncbi:hypothetical protein ACFSR9_13225 [Deinococcus taklimakanensis]|uniref:Uncharacterized protein n=1 Tax=Deinococcus taklimakanensis TaxID=536443 RepID=A0ABW5P5V2_9DEIO
MSGRKRGTEILSIRVSSDVAQFLRAKAAERGLPLTELGGALLEYAAQAEANEAGDALVMPTVRHVVRQELEYFMERLFDFTVRTYMEAGTARRMVMASMLMDMPDGRDERLALIRSIEEVQWSATWDASKRHFAGLAELKREVLDAQERFQRKVSALERADQFTTDGTE